MRFSVGMVVDASIVITENIRRHLSENLDAPCGGDINYCAGRCEVARPVTFSILIIVVVLFPLFTLQGIEGKMFIPLALTMLIAIFVSLVVALTVIPVLSDMILKQKPEKEFKFIRHFHNGYLNFLGTVQRRRRLTLIVSLVMLIVAGVIATRDREPNFSQTLMKEQ